GAWSGLLVLQFALTRVLAETLSMPSDADTFDRHLMYETLSHFLLFGFLLGWFINITDHDRFIWLFSWRRWYFFVVYFGTSPVYSYVSDYGCMEHSMEDIANWGPGMWAAVGSCTTLPTQINKIRSLNILGMNAVMCAECCCTENVSGNCSVLISICDHSRQHIAHR
ncbi:unnamed protein product, partial [Ostreobium quekettii]